MIGASPPLGAAAVSLRVPLTWASVRITEQLAGPCGFAFILSHNRLMTAPPPSHPPGPVAGSPRTGRPEPGFHRAPAPPSACSVTPGLAATAPSSLWEFNTPRLGHGGSSPSLPWGTLHLVAFAVPTWPRCGGAGARLLGIAYPCQGPAPPDLPLQPHPLVAGEGPPPGSRSVGGAKQA